MNNIEQLVNALRTCDVKAEVATYDVTGEDGKLYHCTFINTNLWTGEDTLEFVFNPKTGQRVDTVMQCPVVKRQQQKTTKKKRKKD